MPNDAIREASERLQEKLRAAGYPRVAALHKAGELAGRYPSRAWTDAGGCLHLWLDPLPPLHDIR